MGEWKEWEVPAGGEFRFEVGFDAPFTFKLLKGTAEVFGCELAPGHEYTVTGCKLAVFSFTGATVAGQGGPCQVEYVSTEPATAQQALLNLHVALEQEHARTGKCPRVLLVGAGRNTAARTLVNYAARRAVSTRERPILVDLDVANGAVLFPGTLAAVAPDRPLDVEQAWHALPDVQLLAFFYGSTMVSDNPRLYRQLCERMAATVGERLSHKTSDVDNAKSSGVFIIAPGDVCSETSNTASSLLLALQTAFQANIVVVIGNERLHVTINKLFVDAATPELRVLKIPKSGGIVAKDVAFRRALQAHQLRAYFYGPRTEYHPFSTALSAGNVTIYRVGDASALAPSSALPIGATRKIDATRLTPVTSLSVSQLLYSVLAVVVRHTADEQLDTSAVSIAGFVHVTEVDEQRQTMVVLAPCPGPLPSKFLLLGAVKWIEK